MRKSHLSIKLENIRAIKHADIALDGITVIAGENGCGKSTVSKLLYHLVYSSLNYDRFVEKKLNDDFRRIYKTFDQLTAELSQFLEKDDYDNIRNLLRFSEQQGSNNELFVDLLTNVLASYEKFFNQPSLTTFGEENKLSDRLPRIRMILGSVIDSEDYGKKKVSELFANLKEYIFDLGDRSTTIKESRPLAILNEHLEDAFYDSPLPDSFNLYEYAVPIIDRKNNTLIPIHSIEQLAYIDTPMIFGVDANGYRPHWRDLNKLLSQSRFKKANGGLDQILSKEVLQGEVRYDDQKLSNESFVYKRADGEEFNLLECATGLKSFSILQLLYKNGLLNSKTLLIIDEPEAHLHPQWVVEYARLIVLLNKVAGVKFLIASHHPDMISAIRYISEKEEVDKTLHFYLAEREKDSFLYNYVDQGVDIENIFSSFNIALERIDMYGKTE